MGRRNRPYYRIVVLDSRTRRDGKPIEFLGTYDPMKPKAERATIKEDRILYWLGEGAQASDTVNNILSEKGVLLKAHLGTLSEEQKSQELQKHELAKKARLKKDDTKTTAKIEEAAAPVVKEEVKAEETVSEETTEAPAETETPVEEKPVEETEAPKAE